MVIHHFGINKELWQLKYRLDSYHLKTVRDYKQSISDGDIQYVYIGEMKT